MEQAANRRFASSIHAIPFDERYRDISSTLIRQGTLAAGQAIPREVRAFMQETRAYAPPLRQKDGSEIDYYAERVHYLNRILHKG